MRGRKRERVREEVFATRIKCEVKKSSFSGKL